MAITTPLVSPLRVACILLRGREDSRVGDASRHGNLSFSFVIFIYITDLTSFFARVVVQESCLATLRRRDWIYIFPTLQHALPPEWRNW